QKNPLVFQFVYFLVAHNSQFKSCLRKIFAKVAYNQTMFQLRNILITLGVLLLLGGGWWSWRASQPVLTDEQQITANLESLRQAVQNRKTGRIASYLAEDFTWNGQNKRELESMLT